MMWFYRGKEITDISQFPLGTIGFVYVIFNVTNNKIYIGKKNLYSTRKKKLSKKLLEGRDRRLKTYEYVTKESNWLHYTGSNPQLNEDIKNGDVIVKSIIATCKSSYELTYTEAKYQFKLEVLESDNYNDNILGKFYRHNLEGESSE